MIALSTLSSPVSPIQTSLNMATLLFAPQPLAYARGPMRWPNASKDFTADRMR